MHAEYSVVDDDGQGEKVEHVGEVLPDGRAAVFPNAFRVEAVRLSERARSAKGRTMQSLIDWAHLCHSSRLVVPPDELDSVRIPQLEASQERDGFDAEEPSVDVIPKEEVVCMRRVASYPEDLDEVVELAAWRNECAWGRSEAAVGRNRVVSRQHRRSSHLSRLHCTHP